MRNVILLVAAVSTVVFGLNQQVDEYAIFGRGAGASGGWGITSLWGNPAGIGRMSKLALSAGWQNMWGVS